MAVLKNHRGDVFIPFKDGHKWVHCVRQDQPVRIDKLTHDQESNLRPALLKGEPYPLARACRRFLAFGKDVGITASAKAALKTILKQSRSP